MEERSEGGPGSISEDVEEEEEEEEEQRSGQAQAPVRSMPVSRSYKALVLGGRATVGVPHSEHAPRRGHIESTCPSQTDVLIRIVFAGWLARQVNVVG